MRRRGSELVRLCKLPMDPGFRPGLPNGTSVLHTWASGCLSLPRRPRADRRGGAWDFSISSALLPSTGSGEGERREEPWVEEGGRESGEETLGLIVLRAVEKQG